MKFRQKPLRERECKNVQFPENDERWNWVGMFISWYQLLITGYKKKQKKINDHKYEIRNKKKQHVLVTATNNTRRTTTNVVCFRLKHEKKREKEKSEHNRHNKQHVTEIFGNFSAYLVSVLVKLSKKRMKYLISLQT